MPFLVEGDGDGDGQDQRQRDENHHRSALEEPEDAQAPGRLGAVHLREFLGVHAQEARGRPEIEEEDQEEEHGDRAGQNVAVEQLEQEKLLQPQLHVPPEIDDQIREQDADAKQERHESQQRQRGNEQETFPVFHEGLGGGSVRGGMTGSMKGFQH